MLIDCIAIIAGFIMLIWSADRFIIGAAATARNFDVPPLIIGLTIVGFGTSAPEMMVAGFASYGGSPAMAIGNALGSNITNITLVLGVAALITPLNIHSRIIKKRTAHIIVCDITDTGADARHGIEPVRRFCFAQSAVLTDVVDYTRRPAKPCK